MTLLLGNCREQLKSLADNSIDSVVTDPPYGLAFMNKRWDYDVPSVDIWREVLRVLKPGGHLLAFGGTRTYHRMVVNIEDAGFEIRDQLQWIYGKGFPKSLDISKAIDKAAGAEREVVGDNPNNRPSKRHGTAGFDSETEIGSQRRAELKITVPATDDAKQWSGWGTALKPTNEIVCMARKPLTDADRLDNLARECLSLLFASIARKYLASSRKGFNEASNIARWLAGESTLTQEDLSDLMATLQSGSETNSSLSTELSWLDTLGAISDNANTFTTETVSSLTTDLKILKSCLSKNTQASTPRKGGRGRQSSASHAESLLSALALKLNFILEHSALDLATSKVEELGSHLSPSSKPICLARKPISEKTVAENVLKWGTGGLNIDECRIRIEALDQSAFAKNWDRKTRTDIRGGNYLNGKASGIENRYKAPTGRWPANVIFDEESAALLDAQSGQFKGLIGRANRKSAGDYNATNYKVGVVTETEIKDFGGASRFFYVAKASKRERNAGLEKTDLIWENDAWEKQALKSALMDTLQLARATSADTLMDEFSWSIDGFGNNTTALCPKALTYTIRTALELITELKTSNVSPNLSTRESIQNAIRTIEANGLSLVESAECISQLLPNITNEKTASVLGVVHALLQTLRPIRDAAKTGNFHTTVKPIKLMQYLIKLVTPPGGVVLDPFMGSGSTGCAAKRLGFDFVGIELDPEYFKIAMQRIEHWSKESQVEFEINEGA